MLEVVLRSAQITLSHPILGGIYGEIELGRGIVYCKHLSET